MSDPDYGYVYTFTPKEHRRAVLASAFLALWVMIAIGWVWIDRFVIDARNKQLAACTEQLAVPRAEWCGCVPTNLYVDPKHGKDTNTGATPDTALATTTEAAKRIPALRDGGQ